MSQTARELMLTVFEKCAGASGCDVCRLHMEDDCLFFPELYRLQDQADASGTPLSTSDIHNLIDLCTMCGLCPCQDIKMLILQAKAALSDEKGIPLSNRMTSDVQRAGHWGTMFSKMINPLTRSTPVARLLKKALNIHPQRPLPLFPKESFFLWAKKKKLNVLNDKESRARSKVAYFAGCSAGYLFPVVGKAAVRILEQNGVEVFVPPQECCSMPLVMEGDETSAFKKINTNIETLLEAAHQGYDIVCSCPTCGYFFRKLLLEKARYSEAFQEKTADNSKVIKVPLGSGKRPFTTVSKGAYQKLLKDDGYFSAIDPLKRIELSSKVKDLGEYLLSIQEKRKLKTKQSGAGIPMVYYAPCHQRELQIGQPYYHLLKSLADSDIIQTRGAMQCCGMGGHLGYRKSFHSHTLSIGEPLFEQLLSEKDRVIITDCSSCKIQLQQALSRKVFHPLELL